MPPGMSLFLVWYALLSLNGGWCIAACPIHDGESHVVRLRVVVL